MPASPTDMWCPWTSLNTVGKGMKQKTRWRLNNSRSTQPPTEVDFTRSMWDNQPALFSEASGTSGSSSEGTSGSSTSPWEFRGNNSRSGTTEEESAGSEHLTRSQFYLSYGLQLSQNSIFILLWQGASQHLVDLLQRQRAQWATDSFRKQRTAADSKWPRTWVWLECKREGLTLWYSMASWVSSIIRSTSSTDIT